MRSGQHPSVVCASVLACIATVTAGEFTADATPPHIDVQQGVPTGSMPKGVTISPDGRWLYVSNYGQLNHRNVGIYDAATLRLVDEIDVPGIVVETAISPDGRTLYVSNFRRDSVQFIDLASKQVTHEVRAGTHPKILVLSHDGRRLFAANWASEDVTEIDTTRAEVVRTLAAQRNPRGMAITRDGRLYIANFGSASIDIYEGASMETHRRLSNVCVVPRHLVLSPDETYLYVSCFTGSFVGVLDTRTDRIVHRVPVGRSPKADDVTPDGRYVVTANYGGSSVSIVDTNDWTSRTIEVPGMDAASGVVTAREGLRFFVTGWYNDHLYSVGLQGEGPHYTVEPAEEARTRTMRAYHQLHPAE